jgi:hypothetical protein
MAKTACTVPITQIILDEEIYPRSGVYPKRVSMFAENMRDGFKIDPVEVQIHPGRMGSGKNGVKSTVDPCSKLIRVKGRLDPFFQWGERLYRP